MHGINEISNMLVILKLLSKPAHSLFPFPHLTKKKVSPPTKYKTGMIDKEYVRSEILL
jgi:hypothetical protein